MLRGYETVSFHKSQLDFLKNFNKEAANENSLTVGLRGMNASHTREAAYVSVSYFYQIPSADWISHTIY